jgi:hypothetical protein
VGLWSEAGLLAPGPTLRAFPIRRAADQWLRLRAASGIPGHSGGSAPDSHRLPLTTDRMNENSLQAGEVGVEARERGALPRVEHSTLGEQPAGVVQIA